MASAKYEQSERRKELKRLWHLANKKAQNQRSLEYYRKHKQECISQSSQWRKDHLEFSKQRDAERYLAKREEQIARAIAWRKSHPEQARETNLRIKALKKNLAREQARLWRKRNPHMISFHNNKYRALKVKASVNLKAIKAYLGSVRSKTFFRCYYCEKLFLSSDVHFDHVVPLAKGGQHSVENLCTSCGSCNSSKKDKLIGVWIKKGQQVFAL